MDFLGVIGGYLAESWDMLTGRSGGPFAVRFIMQPVVAMLLGFRAGRADARAGRPPYLWSVFTAGDIYDRRALLRDGWGDVKRVFFIALALDTVYELVVYRWVYPVQSLIVALVLAMLPYLVMRGVVNRLSPKRAPARAESRRHAR